MQTKIKINAVTSEITMTKTTAQKASSINSEEYKELLQATRDFPNFTIKIIAPRTKKDTSRGLTMEYMERLVKAMTNDSERAIKEFEAVKRLNENTNFRFSKPKAYFLSKYSDWRKWLPTVEETQEEQEKITSEAAAVDERKNIFGLMKQSNNS